MLPFTHANSTFSSPKPGPGGNWLNFQRPQSSSLQSGPAPTGWTNHISDHSFSNNHSHQFQPIVAQVITDIPTGFPDFSTDTITSIEPTAFPSSTLPVTQNSQNNLLLDQAIILETHTQRSPLPSRRQASQHPRYTDDDWKKHRPTIKRLYIDQNLSLEKTREIMSSSGFSPSLKKYKEKLKEWKCSKYIPKEKAHWMLGKAEQRKLPHPGHASGKDTVFSYGQQQWNVEKIRKIAQRGKIDASETTALDAPTPSDVTYDTPHHVAPSPHEVQSLEQRTAAFEIWTPTAPSNRESRLQFLKLTWNSYTLTEIEALRCEAHRLDSEGDILNAEKKLREALAGFEHILSATHEETNAAAYQLADFYANHGDMDNADLVLNWMGEKHVDRWGREHVKSVMHYLKVAELFGSWSRHNDALVFLYRIQNIWDESDPVDGISDVLQDLELPRTTRFQGGSMREATRGLVVEETSSTFAETDDPTRVNFQLSLANVRITSGDPTAESLLLLLINQYEKYSERLGPQIMHAKCDLVGLYRRMEDQEKLPNALLNVQEALDRIFDSAVERNDLLWKACIRAAKLHLEHNFHSTAEDMFQRIGSEAEDAHGMDDKATINILIDIGKVYQSANMWSVARQWFERALAASMTAYGLESQTTKRLETALENRKYSFQVPGVRLKQLWIS